MATLWRGIVGPDLVIYVKAVQAGLSTPGEREGAEEMARFGAVEVRKDCGAVVVRVPVGTGDGMAGAPAVGGANGGMNKGVNGTGVEGKLRVEEATLRRLGFEVLEIIRGGCGVGKGNDGGRLGMG